MFEKLESLMFDNVGKKLKNIIKWIMRVEIILLVIFAIIMEFGALIQLFNGASENFLFMLLIPIGLVLAIGVLWFSVVVMYGFAEMVDTAIVNRKEEEKPPYQPKTSVSAQPPRPVTQPKSTPAPAKQRKAEKTEFVFDEGELNPFAEDAEFVDVKCPNCKEQLSFVVGTKNALCPSCGTSFYL